MTRNKFKYGMIALEALAIFLFVMVLLPFAIVVISSAKSPAEITQEPLSLPSQWMNIITNMVNIWTNENIKYQSSFIASIMITVVSLVIICVLSSQAAWALVRTKTRFSNFTFLLFVAAMIIPFQIVMFPLVSWLKTIHDVTGLPLLRNYWGMFLCYAGFGAPFSVFLYHGFIKGVPVELEEAAEIDGCSSFYIFYRIVFPLLKPIHVTVAILNGIWIWNDYLLPLLILSKGNAVMTIPLAVSNFAGAYVKQWDLIMTAILMAVIPVIVLFLFAQKYIIRGMTAGAIK